MSKEKMDCDCKDWEVNSPKLNAGFVMLFTHGGKGYEGEKINYCPWCGKKLKEEPTNELEKR